MARSRIGSDHHGCLLSDLALGTSVGDYVIEARLGARGTGVLYRARNRSGQATIKVLPSAHSWTRSLALQVLADACVVDTIDHPGIAAILECGTLLDCRPWIAFENVTGTTLTSAIGKWSMTALEVATLVRDVAAVLHYAHAHDVVHGSLHPDSIVFPDDTSRAPVCLTDWTEARIVGAYRPIPLLPQISANPYDAPEQRRGEPIDGRADIYALGMIACSALYRTVFDGTVDVPVPAHVPPTLAAIIGEMLHDDPTLRPTSQTVLVIVDSVIASFGVQREAIESFSLDDADVEELPAYADDSVPEAAHNRAMTERDEFETNTVADGVRRRFSSEDGSSVSGEIQAVSPPERPTPPPS